MSLIHFNSRSLYSNFEHIRDYLGHFKRQFNIIAISDNWITADKHDEFNLSGYEFLHIDRVNKKGGGVALFVDKKLNYKLEKSMSFTVDDILECITIEIIQKKKKNVLVSCMYRTPGSKIETSIQIIEEMFANKQKMALISGDFNIDLLNPNHNKNTEDFIETMYSMGFYPMITKPSRITQHSSTLIDNIFYNDLEDTTTTGLLINDITDHLPVFAVFYTEKTIEEQEYYIYKRIRTEESILN